MEKDKGKTKEGGQGKGHSIEGTLPLLLHFPRPLPYFPVTVTICSTFESRRKYSTACVTRSSLNTRALSLVLPHHQHLFDGSFLILSHSSFRWPRAPKEANSTRPRGLPFSRSFLASFGGLYLRRGSACSAVHFATSSAVLASVVILAICAKFVSRIYVTPLPPHLLCSRQPFWHNLLRPHFLRFLGGWASIKP